jgi:hypothetical protein
LGRRYDTCSGPIFLRVSPEVNLTHKLQQIITGCENNKISILAIQEHRRLKTADSLNYEKIGNWTLAHTSSSHDSHGVAILYTNQIASNVASVVKTCIISEYAPTETSAVDSKDRFYDDLRDLILSILTHTIIILAGDFNVRLGKDKRLTNRRIIGNNCYHDITNENGQRLIDLCEATDLRTAHTHFANRRSRLQTYKDPKDNYFQLDHIMINMKWWKSIKNCRSYNSIDIMSDHKIVCANFRLKSAEDQLKETKIKGSNS